MGVPAYARAYTLRSASNAVAGAPASGPGEPGKYTGIPGFLAYFEVGLILHELNVIKRRNLYNFHSVQFTFHFNIIYSKFGSKSKVMICYTI